MVLVKTDLASFSSAGYGTLRIPKGVHLAQGQTIAVTDDDADTLEADVLTVTGNKAEVRVHWGRICAGPERTRIPTVPIVRGVNNLMKCNS